MKRFLLPGFALFAVAGCIAGCKKAGSDITPSLPFTTSFQLLNEQGQQANAFVKGQNFIFRFQVINHSDGAVYFRSPLFDVAPFLEVSNQANVSFGKPYTGVLCTYQDGESIAAHDTLTFSIPWREAAAYPTSAVFCGHATTPILPPGHYQTSFTPSFTWFQRLNTGELSTPLKTNPQTLTLEFDITDQGPK